MPATAVKKNEKARFEAPGHDLRIVLEHIREKFSESGIKQAVPGTGKTINFEPDGFGAQFYETADAEVIATLRAKIEAGNAAFFEVPVPKPASAPVLKQIVGLTARGDTDALVALAKEEEETHQREDVLDAIADALEQSNT